MSENEKKATKSPKAHVDPKVEYLRGMGIDVSTAQDLIAPDVDRFSHAPSDGFRWDGKLHKDFEYYRATDDRSIQVAEDQGYFKLPSDCGVRMLGCHTKNEVIMARTRDVGEAFRAGRKKAADAKSAGVFNNQVPLGGGVFSNERVERMQGASPMGG